MARTPQPHARAAVQAAGRLALLAWGLAGGTGCAGSEPAHGRADPLAPLVPQYRASMARARAWLDGLHLDPLQLRAVGIKGKKKLVEQLDAYHRLWQVADEGEKDRLLERIREIVAITYADRYHDLAHVGERQLKQDATSYLRAALLMERLGLDTTRYRQEIRKVHQRLDGHLQRRGPHQRRVFHWYYRHFDLQEPFPLDRALDSGVIAQRRAPDGMSDLDAYALTHEVYALYEYGDRRDIDPFDEESKAYLRRTIEALFAWYRDKGDPDIAGELVECLHYLRMKDAPTYLEGIRFLLDTQLLDGSWGRFRCRPPRAGAPDDRIARLHPTVVSIGALTAVFERPMLPAPLSARSTAATCVGSTSAGDFHPL